MEYCRVTEYMIRTARLMLSANGIFSKPPPRQGKSLNSEIKNIVIDFYCDNENTRIMPGTRDKVSIAPNVYEQKRLILCTLKELYASFKAKYPNIKSGSLHSPQSGLNGAYLLDLLVPMLFVYAQFTKMLF